MILRTVYGISNIDFIYLIHVTKNELLTLPISINVIKKEVEKTASGSGSSNFLFFLLVMTRGSFNRVGELKITFI